MKAKLIFVFLCLITVVCHAAPDKVTRPVSIQFVGNSFTYYNNGIPHHLAALMKSSKEETLARPKFTMQTISGGKLKEHIDGVKYLLRADSRIKPSAIILQPYSTETINSALYPSFIKALTTLIKQVKESGVRPHLMMTWPYAGDETMFEQLKASYSSVEKTFDISVIPVGEAFQHVRTTYPEIILYSKDISSFDRHNRPVYTDVIKHPSQAGTYLAAATVYAYLYKRTPEGLPYFADLPHSVASQLQKAAWDVVSNY